MVLAVERGSAGPAAGDRIQSTLDWITVLYPVLRAGHPVPPQLAALLAGLTPTAETDATRSAALAEAAHREAIAALRRGSAEQARAWQRLARENGHPGDVAVPAPQRPMVDLSGRHRDPRIAALLNASGLAAGYLYLGRWARAAVTLVVTALVVWFATARQRSTGTRVSRPATNSPSPRSPRSPVRTGANATICCGPRPRWPYSGSWKLAGGARYDNCYYASRAFG